MVYPFLALFWLLIGLGMILHPGFANWKIADTGISFGWLAVVLAGYNLLRWRLRREQTRGRSERDDEPPGPREYNPEFDFTKDQSDEK